MKDDPELKRRYHDLIPVVKAAFATHATIKLVQTPAEMGIGVEAAEPAEDPEETQ